MKHENERNTESTDAETYRTRFERSDADSLIVAITDGIERVTDEHATGISPLQESVNMDALCSLFRTQSLDGGVPNGRVTFSHSGCEITVESDGVVAVAPDE